jgi:hypothetical protein
MLGEIVQEGDPGLARVVRKTTPAAALAALGIVYGDNAAISIPPAQKSVRSVYEPAKKRCDQMCFKRL